MAWWAWCLVGVVLFGIELLVIDVQFYLVFAGLAAVATVVVGLLPSKALNASTRAGMSLAKTTVPMLIDTPVARHPPSADVPRAAATP